MKSIFAELLRLASKRNPLALATVVAVRGSSPQVVGASALFSAKGLVQGTLGGGLLEARAERRARLVLRTKGWQLFGLDLGGEFGSTEEALCGGAVTILIEAVPERHRPVFREMERDRAEGKSGVLVTLVRPHEPRRPTLERRWIVENRLEAALRGRRLRPFLKDIRRSLRRPVPLVERNGEFLYAEGQAPPPRLIIAGAGHIGRALCRLADWLGFAVTVVDDRRAYANARRLPEAERIIVGEIGRSVGRLPLGADTYVVIVTRGHSQDAAALRGCINRRPAYIGLIGSGRKIRLMRDAFLQNGWTTARAWNRVAAPVGLKIHSQTVEEIAVSIAAELVQARRAPAEMPVRREPWFGP